MSSIYVMTGVFIFSGVLFFSLSRVAKRADDADDERERQLAVDAAPKGGEA